MDQDDPAALGASDTEHLLERLLTSTAGCLLYDQLTRLTSEWVDLQTQVDTCYQTLLRTLLDDVDRDPSTPRVAALCADLVRARHAAGVPRTSSRSPGLSPGTLAGRLRSDPRVSVTLARLLDRLDADPERAAVAGHAPLAGDLPKAEVAPATADTPEAAARPGDSIAEQRMHSAYRQHLDRKRDELDKLQITLARKVHEAVAQNKEFGDLLKIERNALQQAESVKEMTALRSILLGGIDELLHSQEALAANLASTGEVLELIETDSARLQDELQKVRLLSLTDDYTGLPNRRAFLRRLDDEQRRAQRYNTPLALAILDLDEFKAVNDNHGHLAGDQVLGCYATQVLSIFRHHDMVARYGGEEFSVLLPNTTLAGAQAALRKVQHKVAASRCEYEGKLLPLPTFSAGVTLYLPGESPTALIQRADQALYRAKQQGRNRIEPVVADLSRLTPAGPYQESAAPD